MTQCQPQAAHDGNVFRDRRSPVSRRVVGWAMATHLRTELVTEALEMAVAQRRPEAVVHHSESLAFGARCRNGSGLVLMAARWSASARPPTLSTHAEARAAIFDFVVTTRDDAIPRWAMCRRWSSNVFMRQTLWTLTGRWRFSSRPTSQLEPGSPAPTRVVTGVLLETHGGN